jgi:FtsZ-binding cell division protein ZapB
MALQEMQALLPSPQLGATDAKSPDSGAAMSNSSKAAKVESAIDYIRQLKSEVSERDRLIESKDQEMEQLREELAALRRRSSVTSAADSATPLKPEPTSSPNTDNGT